MIKTKKMLDFVRNKNPGKVEPSWQFENILTVCYRSAADRYDLGVPQPGNGNSASST